MNKVLTALAMLLLLAPNVSFSQQSDDGNAKLRQRIQKLEKQLEQVMQTLHQQDQLKKENQQLQDRLHKLEEAVAEQAKPPATGHELTKRLDYLEKFVEQYQDQHVDSSLAVRLYGYIKLDMSYDSARTAIGNTALWVESEQGIGNDDQFNMTANQTRLGLEIQAPEFHGLHTSGKIEMDFYGGGEENKAHLRLRQAYINLEWRKQDFSILAGQAWDIVSPLYPDTVNFLVFEGGGNIGYRRPQLRFTKGLRLGSDTRLTVQAALTRTIGHESPFYPSYLDSGEDSGFPTIQTHIGFSFPLLTEKPTVIGFSGHWGQEEYDIDAADNHKRFETWSLSVDIALPLASKLKLKAEFWVGKNLDSYFGGICQGVNLGLLKEISSCGGWLALSIGPFSDFVFNIGAGFDDPEDVDLSEGNRERNVNAFGNIFYSITRSLKVATEIMYMETRYQGRENGENFRIQGAMIYNF